MEHLDRMPQIMFNHTTRCNLHVWSTIVVFYVIALIEMS